MAGKQQKHHTPKATSKIRQTKAPHSVETAPEQTPQEADAPAVIQRALAPASPPSELKPAEVLTLQRALGNRAVNRLLAQSDSAQPRAASTTPPIQTQPVADLAEAKGTPEAGPGLLEENKTGLPDPLKAGVENLSGLSLDDVKVHYNSSKPAQLQALAYAQGAEIHVGPGQEKHLPHEAWHVVQQKQSRVQPMLKTENVAINDDLGLEREADSMGAKALQTASSASGLPSDNHSGNTPQLRLATAAPVAQRRPENKAVTGITHLVKMTEGSIYNQDYLSNEVREVEEGDIVQIETEVKYRSRRGPNQETYSETDETGPSHYRWFKVLTVNGEPAGEDVFIREDTFVDARQSLRDILLARAGELGIDPPDFENYLQDPYSSVVATSSVKSIGESMGKLGSESGLKVDDIRKFNFSQFYQFLMQNNLLTGSCGQTSDMLLEMVQSDDEEPATTKTSIDAMIGTLRACPADPWYCRIMVAPHSFMVERIGNVGRIYQSYFGHYTMMSQLQEDQAYPINKLLDMIRAALNQQTSTEKNRQDVFHARALFIETEATYSLITEPAGVGDIAQNIEERYGERSPEWETYFSGSRTMEEINPTPVHDTSLDDVPNTSYDFSARMDTPLSDSYDVISKGGTSEKEFNEAAEKGGVEALMKIHTDGKFKGFVLRWKSKPEGPQNRFVFGGRATMFSDQCVRFVRIDTTDALESGNVL